MRGRVQNMRSMGRRKGRGYTRPYGSHKLYIYPTQMYITPLFEGTIQKSDIAKLQEGK
jgi:hypothetical protein